ncbi:MAG: hypothetical protein E7603_10365 [Ruminococcaceae bacterium]|nr:hypothetical protein [Oscillospiraceae bacterium]
MANTELQVSLIPYEKIAEDQKYDLDQMIFDLDRQIDLLSSQADKWDYFVSIASGLLCAVLDIFWVGEFNWESGRAVADEKVNEFVKKTANMLGYEGDDLQSAVKFLEKKFPIAADGNTADFGGGLQHHLRDFAHHPTIVGLAFSLLTQFTEKSYGTDKEGKFIIVNVPDTHKIFIGKDIPTKILYGTIIWFFHLVSDVAGSSATVGKTGGTGIPGPILALAKELSVFPIFQNLKVGENTVSVFISKLFNGTFFAEHDENGKIIRETIQKFDLRGELGVAVELGKQSVPVIANECIVRTFYFIRRFIMELRENDVCSFEDLKQLDWKKTMPFHNPTIARMLMVSTGVFTTVDIGEAIVSQKYFISVNYVGVGRFAVAVGQDVAWCLKARDIKKIKAVYENIKYFAFTQEDKKIYERIGDEGMDMNKFGLTLEQTEILYNLEYHKTLNDIEHTKLPINSEAVKALKREWLREWQTLMTGAFSSFLQLEHIELHWYSEAELIEKIEANEPNGTWLRLVLLEAMLFEPYYTLGIEKDKKGNDVPSKKYKDIQNPVSGYKKSEGDHYLENLFADKDYYKDSIKRFRKCHDSVLRELNEVLKTGLIALGITAVITIACIATAGALAPKIAVVLVGSHFAGLHGAALTSACLAYLGGGAIAFGGAGMMGGTIAIVGGGAALGLGVGAGVGGAVGASALLGKKYTIMQSAKLLVSVREIFLNDEHDLEYSNTIYEQYVKNIAQIEKELVELRLQAAVADKTKKEELKELKDKIKKSEESVDAMKIAMKNMYRFKSSFEIGMNQTEE